MRIAYTLHAKSKFLEEKYVKQLHITRKNISDTILKPYVIDRSRGEKITAIKQISPIHSLVVVYKIDNDIMKVITFFPAKRGRYESKIL